MAKFKVGDRVRSTNGGYGTEVGAHYTVAGYACATGIGEWVMLKDFRSYADDGSVPEKDLQPAPLFAVGDKVRSLVSFLTVEAGQVYTVDRVCADGVWLLGTVYMTNEEIKLAPAAPKFKAGDKVRVIKGGYDDGGSSHGASIGEEFIIDRYVSDEDGEYYDAGEWYFRPQELAAVAQQRPLTIQAGKYYKTRDGRKVGPMEGPEYSNYWEKEVLWFAGESYNHDGRVYVSDGPDDADLIAEWPVVAEATTTSDFTPTDDGWSRAPVAVTEATANKFKVGDKVRVIKDGDGGSFHSADIGSEFTVTKVDDDEVETDFWFFQPDEIELAAKPDSALHVTISADTSALDAEIDRVKRRLKKLAKRARKVGIRLDYGTLKEAA